jgi:general secretion pathway protein J
MREALTTLPGRHRGFTLLELLIAITIFSIIATFVYAGLDVVLDTKQQTEQHLQRLAKLQLGLHLMQQDIEQAVNRPIRDEYGDKQPALRGGGLSEMLLELTRGGYANPMKLTRSQLQRVAYQLEEKTLYRVSWPTLDRAQDTEPRRQKLFDGIDSLSLKFIDGDMEQATSWPKESNGNSTTSQALPKGIELVLETETLGTLRRVFRTPESKPESTAP